MTSSNTDLENKINIMEKDIDGIRFYNEELAKLTNSVISTEQFKDEMRQSKKDLDKKWGRSCK